MGGECFFSVRSLIQDTFANPLFSLVDALLT